MVSFGMVAGIMGSFVGTPADLILIRMVADINLPQGASLDSFSLDDDS